MIWLHTACTVPRDGIPCWPGQKGVASVGDALAGASPTDARRQEEERMLLAWVRWSFISSTVSAKGSTQAVNRSDSGRCGPETVVTAL